jgi:hypothetical protein
LHQPFVMQKAASWAVWCRACASALITIPER